MANGNAVTLRLLKCRRALLDAAIVALEALDESDHAAALAALGPVGLGCSPVGGCADERLRLVDQLAPAAGTLPPAA